MEITRHYTATAVIVYENKTLLHLHKKLNIWLPVGGHIDRDELPEESLLREIKEESGLEVEILHEDKRVDFKEVKQILRPRYILLEKINPYHQHIDFIYFAKAFSDKVASADNETNDLKWFNLSELEDLDAMENVKILCREALKFFN